MSHASTGLSFVQFFSIVPSPSILLHPLLCHFRLCPIVFLWLPTRTFMAFIKRWVPSCLVPPFWRCQCLRELRRRERGRGLRRGCECHCRAVLCTTRLLHPFIYIYIYPVFVQSRIDFLRQPPVRSVGLLPLQLVFHALLISRPVSLLLLLLRLYSSMLGVTAASQPARTTTLYTSWRSLLIRASRPQPLLCTLFSSSLSLSFSPHIHQQAWHG